MSTPNAMGQLNLTMGATDLTCYTGSHGPYPTYVDSCWRVMAGAMWEAPGGGGHGPISYFDPEKLDQDMDLVLMGNVLGFNGGPAGFRHSIIMRRNITVCGTKDFLAGNCTVGQERFVCADSFAYCAGGDCATKNKWELSPSGGDFFARLSTSALNGTYDLVADKSSPACPPDISAYHFGTQLGLGNAPHDMHLTRVVDASMVTEKADCIQFHSECNGLQMHFEEAFTGRAYREGSSMMMSIHMIRPRPANDLLEVSKCVFKGRDKAPQLVKVVPDKTGAVIGLSVTLSLFILGAAGLGCCCLSYRRRYIESKIDRAYDVFQS